MENRGRETRRNQADSTAFLFGRVGARESPLLHRTSAGRLRSWSVDIPTMRSCGDSEHGVQPPEGLTQGECENAVSASSGGARILGELDSVLDADPPNLRPTLPDAPVSDVANTTVRLGCGHFGGISEGRLQCHLEDDSNGPREETGRLDTTRERRYKFHSSSRSFKDASYVANCETIMAYRISSGGEVVGIHRDGQGDAFDTKERLELGSAETGAYADQEYHVANALNQTANGATPEVLHFAAGVDCLGETEQSAGKAAPVKNDLMREPAFITNPPALSKRSLQKLVTGQCDFNRKLDLSAIRLSVCFNGYMLEDATGELELHKLPSFRGRVRTSCVLWSRWEQRKNWNARYFVLYRGHWFVFKNRSDYEERGLHGCVASLSLIMNRFQIDLDATRNTRFALTVGDWFCLLVDTGIEKQDRGAWVIHFLAYQNKGEVIRKWFPRLDWDELQNRCRLVARQFSGLRCLF